jgi:hypothetical protein
MVVAAANITKHANKPTTTKKMCFVVCISSHVHPPLVFVPETRGISEHSDASQDEVDERTILREHAFERPHRGEFYKVQVRRGVSSSLCFVSLAAVVLVIVGCILPSMSMAVLGILGVAVESGQEFEEAVNNHSVFTLVRLLMNKARFLDMAGDYIGLGTLSAVFVMTILVVPILQVLALLHQSFMPLTQKQRT